MKTTKSSLNQLIYKNPLYQLISDHLELDQSFLQKDFDLYGIRKEFLQFKDNISRDNEYFNPYLKIDFPTEHKSFFPMNLSSFPTVKEMRTFSVTSSIYEYKEDYFKSPAPYNNLLILSFKSDDYLKRSAANHASVTIQHILDIVDKREFLKKQSQSSSTEPSPNSKDCPKKTSLQEFREFSLESIMNENNRLIEQYKEPGMTSLEALLIAVEQTSRLEDKSEYNSVLDESENSKISETRPVEKLVSGQFFKETVRVGQEAFYLSNHHLSVREKYEPSNILLGVMHHTVTLVLESNPEYMMKVRTYFNDLGEKKDLSVKVYYKGKEEYDRNLSKNEIENLFHSVQKHFLGKFYPLLKKLRQDLEERASKLFYAAHDLLQSENSNFSKKCLSQDRKKEISSSVSKISKLIDQVKNLAPQMNTLKALSTSSAFQELSRANRREANDYDDFYNLSSNNHNSPQKICLHKLKRELEDKNNFLQEQIKPLDCKKQRLSTYHLLEDDSSDSDSSDLDPQDFNLSACELNHGEKVLFSKQEQSPQNKKKYRAD